MCIRDRNDSQGKVDSKTFWLYVYGYPNITYPPTNTEFNLKENVTYNLTFLANHSVGDELVYEFYINNELRYNVTYYGNGTNLTWQFTPNFTDETYDNETKNLTLLVFPPLYPELNASLIYNLTINHTNAPVFLINNFGSLVFPPYTYSDIFISSSLHLSCCI